MPSQVVSGTENNFTKGLVTEFTGLNFPENAATFATNCEFTLVGDVIRREGINLEANYESTTGTTDTANSSYIWSNAGGDGLTRIFVRQDGATLYFYTISAATTSAPLSNQLLTSTVNISSFVAEGATFDATIECQYADGNGYLFVYHPMCDTFYCTYVSGTITGNPITLQIRDFTGVPEPALQGANVGVRPNTLSAEHTYNLANQGWNTAAPWSATSTTPGGIEGSGTITYTVASGITGIVNGQQVLIYVDGNLGGANLYTKLYNGLLAMAGTVTGYSGTSLSISISSFQPIPGTTYNGWSFVPYNIGYVSTWNTDIGNYPSNADVWWYFKDNTDVFNPTTTINNVTLSTGNAPQGHYLLNPFSQAKGSYVAGVTNIATTARPRTGCWYQGRVWYTGVDSQQPATGDAGYYTWTENIYFSQIVETPTDFGSCYQTNDPTSETLFNLLPSDGGVITIQGAGSIYKLFAMQNALLVFAANGVWYVTGSAGIGFSANDYTVVKLSSVQSISSTSFVDVQGLPYFWNEEGIYSVEPAKQGTSLLNSPLHVNPLEVTPLTVGTILTFYNSIPVQSKRYVRGAYHPINYVIQWTYRSTVETGIGDRYNFDTILNYNTYNKAFFPYTVSQGAYGNPYINGIDYVSYPQLGNTTPDPNFKYIASWGGNLSFAEEYDTSYLDWKGTFGNVSYTSSFITGYKLHGQAQHRFDMPYVYVYSRLGQPVAYYIQGIWDYANTGNSGRWSTAQLTNIFNPNYDMGIKRHRIRGRGLVLQIKVSSVDGMPFDIMGWSAYENQEAGV